MNRQELLDKVATKKGFVRIVKDELASDSVKEDKVEKRILTIETLNTDGTSGMQYVYYMHDTTKDVAKFYNIEPEHFDTNEVTKEMRRERQMEKYLADKYVTFFTGRFNFERETLEAEVYELVAGSQTVTKKNVIVVRKDKELVDYQVV